MGAAQRIADTILSLPPLREGRSAKRFGEGSNVENSSKPLPEEFFARIKYGLEFFDPPQRGGWDRGGVLKVSSSVGWRTSHWLTSPAARNSGALISKSAGGADSEAGNRNADRAGSGALARTATQPLPVLDFGLGSGCLLLALSEGVPNATGQGVDSLCERAIAGPGAMWPGTGWRTAAKFMTAIGRAACGCLTWLLSNPPYVPTADLAPLAVGGHEARERAWTAARTDSGLSGRCAPVLARHTWAGGCAASGTRGQAQPVGAGSLRGCRAEGRELHTIWP